MKFNEMTIDEQLAWGRAERTQRMRDLQDRSPSGLLAAQSAAEQRRKAVGATRVQASRIVMDVARVSRAIGIDGIVREICVTAHAARDVFCGDES